MIVVPSVPHEGTHFMRDHLLAELETWIRHPFVEEQPRIRELLDGGAPCIIPRRNEFSVAESWARHGKNITQFAGWSLREWWQQQAELVAPFAGNVFYLNLDDEALRDEQLSIINNTLGTVLTTDWPVVRQDDV